MNHGVFVSVCSTFTGSRRHRPALSDGRKSQFSGKDRGAPVSASMSAQHSVARPAQVLREIFLHCDSRLERHRIQMLVELGKKTKSVTLHKPRGFDSLLVIGQSRFGSQSGHADIHARQVWFAERVGQFDRPEPGHCRIEQHHVNVMMILGGAGGKLS
jgi:hypothetical protein